MARKAAAVVPSSSLPIHLAIRLPKPAGVSDPFASSKPMGMGFKGSAAKPMMAVKKMKDLSPRNNKPEPPPPPPPPPPAAEQEVEEDFDDEFRETPEEEAAAA